MGEEKQGFGICWVRKEAIGYNSYKLRRLSFVFGFIIHVAYTLATNFTSNSAKIPPYPSNGDLVHDSESGHLSSDPMAVVAGHSKYKSKEQVKELVDSSKGYFVRDYSVWLGWNNVRFVLLLHNLSQSYKYKSDIS